MGQSCETGSHRRDKKKPLLCCDSVSSSMNSYDHVVTLKKPHGKTGSYTHDDGSIFIGDLDEQGTKCGFGHLEAPSGSTYDGYFQKGLPNGVGIMRFPDSSR